MTSAQLAGARGCAAVRAGHRVSMGAESKALGTAPTQFGRYATAARKELVAQERVYTLKYRAEGYLRQRPRHPTPTPPERLQQRGVDLRQCSHLRGGAL